MLLPFLLLLLLLQNIILSIYFSIFPFYSRLLTKKHSEEDPARSSNVLSLDDDWSDLSSRLSRDLLHPNHFLLVRLAERRIQALRRALRAGGHDGATRLEALRRQRDLFRGLEAAMAAADPPGDLWAAAAERAEGAILEEEQNGMTNCSN